MKHRAFRFVLFCLALSLGTLLCAQGREYIQAHYTKLEYEIPVRDGTKLFTAVYLPKDTARSYPIMLERTPYTVSPYGIDQYPDRLGPSERFATEGFIFAYQDVRGRFMSEGVFEDMRAHKPEKRGPKDIDESSDTYDTIDWLLQNVPNNNGRVGMWGISYPGFYVAAGMIDAHPALKAASPQAPVGDCYMGDDCYHNGALWLPHNFSFYASFVERPDGPERPTGRFQRFEYGTPDGYEFYLRMGPVSNANALYFHDHNPYWNHLVEHTAYDEFWKSRAVVRFFRNLPPAILTVGGWFDAEDLSGTLRVFRAAEKVLGDDNHLVMGPWPHGGWARSAGDRLGNLSFSSNTAEFYREHIEFPFFMERLKDKKQEPLPKAYVFETGANQWRALAAWPPKNATATTFYLGDGGRLSPGQPPRAAATPFDEYISDPNKPVPFLGYITQGMTPDYMTEDQRFAAQRPDVLVYQTEALADDLTIAGPVSVRLFVSTTGTDSDFVVKLIDVYPGDFPNPSPAGQGGQQPAAAGPQRPPQNAVKMGGYQQLVRGEPFRGKYRNSFEKPEPFKPGKIAKIEYAMPDVYHTFRRGHRLMVQVQSSWFPLADRNPQKFIEIPKAQPSDFRKAVERVYRSRNAASAITVLVEK